MREYWKAGSRLLTAPKLTQTELDKTIRPHFELIIGFVGGGTQRGEREKKKTWGKKKREKPLRNNIV